MQSMDQLEAVRLRYPSKIVSIYVRMVVAPIMRFFPFSAYCWIGYSKIKEGPSTPKKMKKNQSIRYGVRVIYRKETTPKKETWRFSVHGEILRAPHVSFPFCFPLKSNFSTFFFFFVCVFRTNRVVCTLMACFLLPPLPYIVVASLLDDFNGKV